MKYTTKMGSGTIFLKIGSDILNSLLGLTHTDTYTKFLKLGSGIQKSLPGPTHTNIPIQCSKVIS
jgi:hypothetical protein